MSNTEGLSESVPLLISVPDAERLMLQTRFVRNQFEAEILADLETRIRAAKLLEPVAVPPDLVTMNSRLIFEDESTGERREIAIVYPQDADASKGNVSVLAPVGTALLGLSTGQSIVWPFPDGSARTLQVISLLYQPEAAEDAYADHG